MKRNRFWIKCYKLKYLFYVFIASMVVVIGLMSSYKTEFVGVPQDKIIVVIDAGHGGVDGGAKGAKTGAVESELNLVYAKELKSLFKEYGFEVVMTRESADGLYDSSAKNLKKSDMKKRRQIVENSSCDMLISLHMNSYPLSSSYGAQVFFAEDNEAAEKLGRSIQTQLKNILQNTTKKSKVGDYYILNCTTKPAVLIECGFLSNPEEELLLQKTAYQKKLCYAVLCGVIEYFGIGY